MKSYVCSQSSIAYLLADSLRIRLLKPVLQLMLRVIDLKGLVSYF